MRIGIFGATASATAKRYARTALDGHGIDTFAVGLRESAPKADCIIVLGGDRGVRNYFHHVDDASVPVLGIGEAESGGFLTQVDVKELHAYARRLKKHDYDTEIVPRLAVAVDGKTPRHVLNDVAVFPSRSAVLMEHTLRIDETEMWHDESDGVIISTPVGSSAYSMSAGGPVIFQNSQVFGLLSVNSLDVTRRPLIVPDRSRIQVDAISSSSHCEAVFDGIARLGVKKSLECTKSPKSARIVRLEKNASTVSALEKKVKLADQLRKMSPSSKLLLKILEYEGELSQKDLVAKTMLPQRTVRLALRNLLKEGYAKRRVSTRDARQKIYEISRSG